MADRRDGGRTGLRAAADVLGLPALVCVVVLLVHFHPVAALVVMAVGLLAFTRASR